MERLLNVHPGDVLREDYLLPLGMSPYRLAKVLGMSQTAVGEILHGKRSITPATALRLARFFGSTAEFWLNLQAAYDLEEERRRIGAMLSDVQPCDMEEERRRELRELEQRRQQWTAALAQERERMAGELEEIEPLETAETP